MSKNFKWVIILCTFKLNCNLKGTIFLCKFDKNAEINFKNIFNRAVIIHRVNDLNE